MIHWFGVLGKTLIFACIPIPSAHCLSNRDKKPSVVFEAPPTAFVYSFERRGHGEQTTSIRNPSTIRTNTATEHRYPATTNTLYPALSPNRRRMLPQPPQNDLLRTWTHQIGAHTDLHKLNPSPIPCIKVLRSAMNPWIHWFISDRIPRVPSYLRVLLKRQPSFSSNAL